MTLVEQQTQDLLNAIADDPTVATIDGVEHNGLASGLTKSRTLQEGGFLDEPDMQWVTTRKVKDAYGEFADRFTTEPTENSKLIINSVTYRIQRIIKDSVVLQLDLMTPNK